MDEITFHRIVKGLTQSSHKNIAGISVKTISMKASHAQANDRKREMHIFHSGHDDPLQRMLNAIQPGSYIAPHRHSITPKAESVILLQGSLGFVCFSDEGVLDEKSQIYLSSDVGVIGVDCRAGVWHTCFALKKDTVVFEVKPGPFNSSTDKEFPAWAPQEDDAGCCEYYAHLEDKFRSHFNFPKRTWK